MAFFCITLLMLMSVSNNLDSKQTLSSFSPVSVAKSRSDQENESSTGMVDHVNVSNAITDSSKTQAPVSVTKSRHESVAKSRSEQENESSTGMVHQVNVSNAITDSSKTRQCFRPNMDLSSIQSENHHPLPKPYLNVGFPKAGSSSLHAFFKCGGINSNHFECKGPETCGECMENAIRQGLPPLKTCGNYEAFTQLDVTLHSQKKCYWPQIEALEQIHHEAPNATFILNFRNMPNWVRSLQHWGHLDDRMMACKISGSPVLPSPGGSNNNNATNLWLEDFFCNQVERVRDFVVKHPSHALIEVDIEDPSAGEFLSHAFDIKAACWGQSNKN
jgi:hypothetical protein